MADTGCHPVRLGLVGFGRHLRRYLMPNIIGEPRLQVCAVAERQTQLRADATAQFSNALVFDDADDLLTSGAVDAAVISTDPHSHPRWAARALELGLHVFVEKPLGTDPERVDDLATMADDRDLVAMNGTMWRWAPVTDVLRSRLDRTGARTRLLALTVTLPPLDLHPAWRGEWSMDLLETAFFDAFIHPLDWSTLFLGPVRTVAADVVEADKKSGRVVTAVRLFADDGAIATLSMVTGSDAYQVRAWGHLDTGALWEIDTLQELIVTEQPTWPGTAGGMRDRSTLHWQPGQLYRGWGRHGYAEQFTAFADAITTQRPSLASNLRPVAASMRVLTAAVASARTGQPANVEAPAPRTAVTGTRG